MMERCGPARPSGRRPVLLGVSACLLGEHVRFDGGHKLDSWITHELGGRVRFVPVCPEAEAGFGVPREAMRLTGAPDNPRLVTKDTGRDLTAAMLSWIAGRVEELAGMDLSGFIFKSKSPSCGLARIRVHPDDDGEPVPSGAGLFARAFLKRLPLIPVAEESGLVEAGTRRDFIRRVFAPRTRAKTP
jgi:uncharacterized protein YbbK (DUF523 family)